MITNEQVRKIISSARTQLAQEQTSNHTIRLLYEFGSMEFEIRVKNSSGEEHRIQLGGAVSVAVEVYNELIKILE